MSLGSSVRRLFGRHEYEIAALYRSIFIDIDDYVSRIKAWVPEPRNILEVGCGEGAITERLAVLYPQAKITAIDVTPRVGRLYRGRTDTVAFYEKTVQAMAAERPHSFDFIILSDVIHHVPEALRNEIIQSIRLALAPGGKFIFKDWEQSGSLIHWMCHASDRWLTGDKIRYLSKAEADAMIESSFPGADVAAEARVKPWQNNFAILVQG